MLGKIIYLLTPGRRGENMTLDILACHMPTTNYQLFADLIIYPLPIPTYLSTYLQSTYIISIEYLSIYATSSKSNPASWKCAEWIV